MSLNIKQKDEGPDDLRPYLSIPYWTAPLPTGEPADNGVERPLPASIVSWDCQGIHASAYTPGQPLNVTVDIVNAGAGNLTALATVAVYWADAGVGFGSPLLFAVRLVPLPARGAQVTTTIMTAVIPSNASPHICLLAKVSHPLDVPGKLIDPLNDRHWAQRNLFSVAVSAGKPLRFPFFAINPFQEDKKFFLTVQQVNERVAHTLGLRHKLTHRVLNNRVGIKVLDSLGQSVVEAMNTVTFSLALSGSGRRKFHLVLEFDDQPGEGEFATMEILLGLDKNEQLRHIGSLGLIIQKASPY